MTRTFKNLSFVLLWMIAQTVFSAPDPQMSGLFFDVSSTGLAANVNITLCLNGKKLMFCQNYNATALELRITTAIPNKHYPYAGIRINTPSYAFEKLGVECMSIPNGYCVFEANHTKVKEITLINTSVGGVSLNLSSAPLPAALQGKPYNTPIMVIGGVTPYNFSVIRGSLPPGLTLDSASGVISGTPTTTGNYSFTSTVTDSSLPPTSRTQVYTVFVSR